VSSAVKSLIAKKQTQQLVKVGQISTGQLFGLHDVAAERDYTYSLRCLSLRGTVLMMNVEEFLRIAGNNPLIGTLGEKEEAKLREAVVASYVNIQETNSQKNYIRQPSTTGYMMREFMKNRESRINLRKYA